MMEMVWVLALCAVVVSNVAVVRGVSRTLKAMREAVDALSAALRHNIDHVTDLERRVQRIESIESIRSPKVKS